MSSYGHHGLYAPDDRGPPQCDRCGEDIRDDGEIRIWDGLYCEVCAEQVKEKAKCPS